jgi:hypothetical protein
MPDGEITVVCRLSFHQDCAGFTVAPTEDGEGVYLVDCACICHLVSRASWPAGSASTHDWASPASSVE